jgi:diguanylate cyclase (GGDEF)-like protein/PAS domain S-box-containing protein
VVTSNPSNSIIARFKKTFFNKRRAPETNPYSKESNSVEGWKGWLAPPDFEDPDLNRLSRAFYNFLLATPIICALLAFVLTLNGFRTGFVLAIFGTIMLTAIFAVVLIRRKQLSRAGGLFLSIMWLIISYVAVYLDNGLSSPVIGGYLVVILGAGLFLGVRASLIATCLSLLSIGLMFIGDRFGLIRTFASPQQEASSFISHGLIFIVGLLLINIAAYSIQGALIRTRTKEDELRDKNLQLQEVLASLEARIVERTEEILEQKQFYEALMLNSPIAIVTLNSDHRIQACNPAFEKLFGYTQNDILGKELDGLITDTDTHQEANHLTRKVISGEMIKKTTRRRRKDGTLVDVEVSGVPVLVNGHQIGVLALYNDISEQIKVEEYLKYLATHDPLTVLPNRSLFYEHLNRSLITAKRESSRLAVFFLDLDGFKIVNDLFGHIKGDELLQEVAARFRHTLRASDLVARLGGDEFAFVCKGIHSAADAEVIAKKILNSFSEPFLVSGQSITIFGSLGISLYPEDGEEARTLLKSADSAMYRVKGLGKNHYRFYSRAETNASLFGERENKGI